MLPSQINELIFQRHLENDFTEVASDTALSFRVKLLELEEERLNAIVERGYEGFEAQHYRENEAVGSQEGYRTTGKAD